MKKICFIFFLFILFPYVGFTQNVDNNQTVYSLSPLISISPKIYILYESDLSKYQLPQNYMIVRNPSKNTVTLWEFPNEFTAGQAQQLPATTSVEQSKKTVQEKQRAVNEQKALTVSEQKAKILESFGVEPDKEASIFDLFPGMK
jgi:hypothetical protein